MNWYLLVLKKYAVFSGRARRKEFWMFSLYNFFFLIVMMTLDNVWGTTIGNLPYGAFYLIYGIGIMIPGLAVTVRRLHDVGKSGWMILIALIPLIGAIWLLVLMIYNSDVGQNEYGPNPKEVQTDDLVQDKPDTFTHANSDIIILIVVIWMFFNRFIEHFYPIHMNMSATFIGKLPEYIWAIVPLSLAFAVKDKSKRILIFILGGIYLIDVIYFIIMNRY